VVTGSRPCLPWGTSYRGCPEPAVTAQVFRCCGKEILLCAKHRAEAEFEVMLDSTVAGRTCLSCGAPYLQDGSDWLEWDVDTAVGLVRFEAASQLRELGMEWRALEITGRPDRRG
jgi:hypothetical protein